MNSLRTSTLSFLAVVTIGTAAVAATGCAAPTAEPTGSKSDKLLAPKAVLQSHASAATRKALGISEWKVYRGKTDYVLTGYDSKGKAVKGIALGFHAGKSKTQSTPVLRGRLLDGSRYAALYEYSAKKTMSSNKSVSVSTKTFMQYATFDMGAAATSIYRKSHGGKSPKPGYFGESFPIPGAGTTPADPATPPTTPADPATPPTTPGIPPFDPSDPFGGLGYPGGDPMGGATGGACGMDMMTIMMSAMSCLMGAGGGGGSSPLMCLQAAMAGAMAGGSCAPPGGGTGADPYGTGGGTGADPYGTGGGTGADPYGTGGGTGADPYGTGGGDPYGSDPYGTGGGDPYGSDPYGSGAAGGAAGGGMCSSCPPEGGYDDLGADPMSGDVYGGEGGMGDFGPGY